MGGLDKPSSNATEDITVIVTTGDIIIDLYDEPKDVHVFYRVDSACLKETCVYFDRLLQPGAFQEGEYVSVRHKDLLAQYANLATVPSSELPHIRISHVGNISQVKDVGRLMEDFLRIIHNVHLKSTRIPIANLANIAVVADRFDAAKSIAKFLHASGGFSRRIKPQSSQAGEEPVRQRILIGALLGNEESVIANSAALIHMGSKKWLIEEDECHGDEPAWWHLPNGIEEELQYRRDCVFNTLNSLLQHCVEILTGSSPSCKLFFGNSPACDSYQLGELIRFLKRQDLFWLQGSFMMTSSMMGMNHRSKPGNIQDIIDKLKQIPSYQIDRDHHHCGPKKLLSVGLDLIQRQLSDQSLGICLECWESHREAYSWSEARRLPLYNPVASSRGSLVAFSSRTRCKTVHPLARDMFTAVELDWSSLLTKENGPRTPFTKVPLPDRSIGPFGEYSNGKKDPIYWE